MRGNLSSATGVDFRFLDIQNRKRENVRLTHRKAVLRFRTSFVSDPLVAPHSQLPMLFFSLLSAHPCSRRVNSRQRTPPLIQGFQHCHFEYSSSYTLPTPTSNRYKYEHKSPSNRHMPIFLCPINASHPTGIH